MRLNEVTYTDAQPIDGYGPGFFRIGGQVVEGGALVLPSGVQSWAGYDDLDPLLQTVGQIDVLFIGTGAETAHIPPAVRKTLEDAGLAVEPMNSPSACRTYNVLLSEGRRIGAALLPVERVAPSDQV
ncbi:Mth938-like domain-containing protein [Pseudaestuariivita rosea]|uniref:Mth938-like domain-containing protein n=1 Tax=Pseudaestuariivita rosea TaxID=2763263 RepID=UPI001ABA09A9|nr:Mth938-like domain-containing protein [Pseudaestuariivita rosea]